jgi:hypothetical protein
MGTSCHTLSWFSRNCYKQLVFCRLIWVLSLAVADLLHCSDCGRVRCSDVVEDHCEQVRLRACKVSAEGRNRRKEGFDVPTSETHVASKAFERLNIGIYSYAGLA